MNGKIYLEEIESFKSQLLSLITEIYVSNSANRTSRLNIEKAKATLFSLMQLFKEIEMENLADTTGKLFSVISELNFSRQNVDAMCRALKQYISLLPMSMDNINPANLGRFMNQVKLGYYPTDLKHVSLIKSAINFPDDAINIIDPCCGEGIALSKLAKNTNAVTYGAEIDEIRALNASKLLSRMAIGDFFKAEISKGNFHMVFLNPPYMYSKTSTHSIRSEFAFLCDSIPLLAQGGLLIYIIPYPRISSDICKVLSNNFTDISIYRFLDDEYKKYKQVVIFAIKRKYGANKHTYNALMDLTYNLDNIPTIDTISQNIYQLPDISLSVKKFRGHVFNKDELISQFRGSDSISHFFDTSKLDEMQHKPPLPLSLDQIGLIGASGSINGLVECTAPHIIKGIIIKAVHTEKHVENEKSDYVTTVIKETISNKIILTVCSGSGVKRLI